MATLAGGAHAPACTRACACTHTTAAAHARRRRAALRRAGAAGRVPGPDHRHAAPAGAAHTGSGRAQGGVGWGLQPQEERAGGGAGQGGRYEHAVGKVGCTAWRAVTRRVGTLRPWLPPLSARPHPSSIPPAADPERSTCTIVPIAVAAAAATQASYRGAASAPSVGPPPLLPALFRHHRQDERKSMRNSLLALTDGRGISPDVMAGRSNAAGTVQRYFEAQRGRTGQTQVRCGYGQHGGRGGCCSLAGAWACPALPCLVRTPPRCTRQGCVAVGQYMAAMGRQGGCTSKGGGCRLGLRAAAGP